MDNVINILENTTEKYERKYKCPYCETRSTRDGLISHIDQDHTELIPKDYTAARVVFNLINKKENGNCIVCRKHTKWNSTANRYDRLCSPKCTKIYKTEIIDKRMLDKHGKTHLLNDPEQQKKMLEKRSISGKYKFKDGGIKSYVGSYEKKLLEFMDKVLEIPSKDILTPGPIFYYEFKGKKLAWITDMIYIPFNLVFDVKDGGKNKNTHPDMQEYRDKQIEKEKAIIQSKQYNYIRLTDNNFQQLLEVMADIKSSLMDESNIKKEPIIHINETMVSGVHSATDKPVVYLLPYSRNNIGVEGIGMITDIMSNNVFIVDSNTCTLQIKDKDYFKDYFYSILKVDSVDFNNKYKSVLLDIKENREITDPFYLYNLFVEDTNNILQSLMVENYCSVYHKGFDFSKFDPINEYYKNMIDNKIYLLRDFNKDNIRIKVIDNINEESSNDSNRFVEGYIDPRQDCDYDEKELQDGINIETEHVSNRYYSKIIAKDHLDKDPNYYKKLIKMEKDNSTNTDEGYKPSLYISRLNGTKTDPRPNSDYSNFELTLGRSIEFEHTSDYDIATVIAKDHLDEFPNYYSLMLQYNLVDYDRDIDAKSSNINKKKSILENIITEVSNNIIEVDMTTVDDLSIIDESSLNKSDVTPVYILITDTGSRMGSIIKKITKSTFNHVSLSFDHTLDKLYSFGVGDENNKLSFSLESRENTYIKRLGKVNSQVFTVFINNSQAKLMKVKLDEFIARRKKLSYNWIGLIGVIIGKPIAIANKMFCSEFVDNMFKYVGIDLTHKDSGLTNPGDFSKITDKRVYKIYEGDLDRYNPNSIVKVINKAKENFISNSTSNIIKEATSFPVQFDKEGNLLIKNYKKIDFEKEYNDSHKLLIIYEKNNNIEGIKYELSKLWFINSIIESKIYDKQISDKDKKEFIKYRARVLNDFNKYLNFVNSKDTEFNFTEYYKSTPFSDTEIFISKHTISGIKNIIKGLFI